MGRQIGQFAVEWRSRTSIVIEMNLTLHEIETALRQAVDGATVVLPNPSDACHPTISPPEHRP
jgi:hypothetical protein